MRRFTNYSKYGLLTEPQQELIRSAYLNSKVNAQNWIAIKKDLVTYGELLDTNALLEQEHWLKITKRINTLEISVDIKYSEQAVENIKRRIKKLHIQGLYAKYQREQNIIVFKGDHTLSISLLVHVLLNTYQSREAEALVLKHSKSNLLLNTNRIYRQIESRFESNLNALELILTNQLTTT